jgi:hypothetical protein
MKSTKQAVKEVTVLNVYKFREVARICFEVLASNGTDKYTTCFSNDAAHGSCTCDGFTKYHKACYHLTGLRPRAQEYFESRQPVAPVAAPQKDTEAQRRRNAPLNDNRGFSLMR